MLVLGWHGGIRQDYEDMPPGWSTHDGAAVLVRDGEVLAAVEEERLNRVKHSNFFPVEALRACLQDAGAVFDDIDVLAMNFAQRPHDVFPADAGLPSPSMFLESADNPLTVPDNVRQLFLRGLDWDPGHKMQFVHHHTSHLWSSWGTTPWPTGLCVSFDGSGDHASGMVAVGEGNKLLTLRTFAVDQSLGNLYSDLIRFLGYRRFDEYKVMGLAPYGEPSRFRPLFRSFYDLLDHGDYRLSRREERWSHILDVDLLQHARRPGEPLGQIHRDFAAALQEALETIVWHVLEHFRDLTGERRLCLSGGVTHNSTMNGKILYSGKWQSVHAQPAAHDAGGAWGAALAVLAEHGALFRSSLAHVFLGPTRQELADPMQALGRWSDFVTVEACGDVFAAAADLLAAGYVIGWIRGRSEFGPRALGHRSILADPRPYENVARINSMIKNREGYRPFAPAVLEEHIGDYFEVPTVETNYSFMTYVLRVRVDKRPILGAVTHVDGTARVQSVSRATDPGFARLIEEFARRSTVPVLLNTSFNNNCEPIVESLDDALACFVTADLDFLVVGDYVVRKVASVPSVSALLNCRVRVPTSRKLVQRSKCVRTNRIVSHSLEPTASRDLQQDVYPVTAIMFDTLARANGDLRFADLLTGLASPEPRDDAALTAELYNLWRLRAVCLIP